MYSDRCLVSGFSSSCLKSLCFPNLSGCCSHLKNFMPVFCALDSGILKNHQVILICRQVCKSLPWAHDMNQPLIIAMSIWIKIYEISWSQRYCLDYKYACQCLASIYYKVKIAKLERWRFISLSNNALITNIPKLWKNKITF